MNIDLSFFFIKDSSVQGENPLFALFLCLFICLIFGTEIFVIFREMFPYLPNITEMKAC